MPAPDPDTSALAHDLRIACMRVARRVRYDADNTIPPHLFSILVRLAEQPRTVGELASIEQVSAPSMSRAVGHVCDAGWAARSADEHDGRLVRLTLTPAGVETVRRERAHRDVWMTERLEGFTGAQRTLLREATDLLAEVVDR